MTEGSGPGGERPRGRLARFGLAAGPLAAALVHALLPDAFETASGAVRELSPAARSTAALGVWMAIWWMTEAAPLPATSLLPIVLLPLFGAATVEEAAAPYASPVIYLFFGGFLLAASMHRWGLDRRIALFTLLRVGSRPHLVVGGFMVATAVLSSCVSNTATAVMMVPIAAGVLERLGGSNGTGASSGPGGDGGAREARTRRALFLGIAYAASIGGLGTVIGSPPNGLLVQFAANELDVEITFAGWLRVGVPLVAVLLPLAWWLLTRVVFPVPTDEIEGARELFEREQRELGPMKAGERWTLAVFSCAVLAWLFRPALPWGVGERLGDAGIAMAAGLSLFVLPVDRRERGFALDWSAAQGLPWGVLVLFGGGLSLARALGEHGLDEYLGSHAVAVAGWPIWAVVAAVTAGVVFLTELTSNTASAATLVPLLAALAPGLGAEPMQLALPATLAASCAFMLPVATPPNAVVFSSGGVSIGDMCRAGLWLNLIAIAVLAGAVPWLLLPLWGP